MVSEGQPAAPGTRSVITTIAEQNWAIFTEWYVRYSLRQCAPQRTVRSPRSRTAPKASAVEVFQLADEGALIGGTAAVLFAITLVVRAAGVARTMTGFCKVGLGLAKLTCT